MRIKFRVFLGHLKTKIDSLQFESHWKELNNSVPSNPHVTLRSSPKLVVIK